MEIRPSDRGSIVGARLVRASAWPSHAPTAVQGPASLNLVARAADGWFAFVSIDSMPLTSQATGKLISFEGSEGSGKSTQIVRLLTHLQQAGREVVATREPGGTELGERIRDILLHKDEGQGMCPEAELLLFTAARAQLVRKVITPALARGAIVVSDRFLDSSTVYQGAARNLAPVPTEVSLARVRQRSAGRPDRIEREDAAFFQKVREAYLQIAQAAPRRILLLDGTQSPDAIEQQIWAEVEKRLG